MNFILLLSLCNTLVMPEFVINRRTMMGSIFTPSLFGTELNPIKDDIKIHNIQNIQNIQNIENRDYYGYWPIKIVPPPIEKIITHDELREKIKNNEIISLQTAVQHDNVIATTKKNHRLSCPIKDRDFPNFLEEIKDRDGNLPVIVLPIDKNRQIVRNIAQSWLGLYIIRTLVYEIPKNIKLLNECNSTMTTRQKILYILENEENIFDVIKNSTKI